VRSQRGAGYQRRLLPFDELVTQAPPWIGRIFPTKPSIYNGTLRQSPGKRKVDRGENRNGVHRRCCIWFANYDNRSSTIHSRWTLKLQHISHKDGVVSLTNLVCDLNSPLQVNGTSQWISKLPSVLGTSWLRSQLTCHDLFVRLRSMVLYCIMCRMRRRVLIR